MREVIDLGSSRTLNLRDGRVDGPDGTSHLTDIELRLTRYLIERHGSPVGRDELEQAVWGYRPGVLSRTVFTTIGRLRQKLEVDPHAPLLLVTVAGLGYAWAVAPSAEPRVAPAIELTPFVGRPDVVASVVEALGAARVVSLTGPGGAGKTRVAVEVARRQPGRVALVFLEPVDLLDAVPAAIATALGTALGGRADPWGELAERTEGELLAVLDNAEHLPGLAEALWRWVTACPALRLLVTTRVRLGLRAEVALAIPPMSTPPSGVELGASEAGQLALQQARRARPGWEPEPKDRDDLAALCRGVGGNPLAIELATAWLRVLDPAEVLGELGSGGVLVALDRDVPARHRSVEVALEASWRLLSGPARGALEALGCCVGPVDRATAAAVAGADLATLSQLVDASLLHRHRVAASTARFDIHPLVRQSARARLAARSDASEVSARHARWFLGRIRASVELMDAEGEDAGRRQFGADHEDFLAAWADRARAGDEAALAGAAWPLYRWLDSTNHFLELETALRLASEALRGSPTGHAIALLGAGAGLDYPDGSPGSGVEGELRVAALIQGAIAALRTGRNAAAGALVDEALALMGDRGSFLAGFGMAVRGAVFANAGRWDEAKAELSRAFELRSHGRGRSRPMVHLGEVLLASGYPSEAREQLERALAECRACDDRAFACLALCRLGEALAATGADPAPVCAEAVEEGVGSRLPRVWWSAALGLLGEWWLRHGREDGAVLLAAAVKGPSMGPAHVVQERYAAARALVAEDRWVALDAEGRGASDRALLLRVRR